MEGAALPYWPAQPPLGQHVGAVEQMAEQDAPGGPAGGNAQPLREQLHGAWGIGVSQESRPEGVSYKVHVCLQGKTHYLGR
jgi:hypothetical protein